MDLLEEKLASDGLVKLRAAKAAWKAGSVEELRETVVEYQLIEAAKDLGLCTKTEMKALHGMLNKRNECAHPNDFFSRYEHYARLHLGIVNAGCHVATQDALSP